MPLPNDTGWLLRYPDPRSDTRMLTSIPSLLLRDLHMLAKAREISLAELVRRALTREIATEIRERPSIAASFKGKIALDAEAK